jgi:DNA-binding MarR family transcriptional regulator
VDEFVMKWNKLEEADWLFRKTVRRFVKERDKILIEGITLPALLVLHKITRDGAQRLGDLAEQLDFTSGAITALCDKLEEKKYAIRRKGEDRRTVWLDITVEGRSMCMRNENIGSRCIAILFDGLTEAELDIQIKVYQQIFDNLKCFSKEILDLAKKNKAASFPTEKSTPEHTFLTY